MQVSQEAIDYCNRADQRRAKRASWLLSHLSNPQRDTLYALLTRMWVRINCPPRVYRMMETIRLADAKNLRGQS